MKNNEGHSYIDNCKTVCIRKRYFVIPWKSSWMKGKMIIGTIFPAISDDQNHLKDIKHLYYQFKQKNLNKSLIFVTPCQWIKCKCYSKRCTKVTFENIKYSKIRKNRVSDMTVVVRAKHFITTVETSHFPNRHRVIWKAEVNVITPVI